MIKENLIRLLHWIIKRNDLVTSIGCIVLIVYINFKNPNFGKIGRKRSKKVIKYEELFIPKFEGNQREFNSEWKYSNDIVLPDIVKKYYDNRYPFTFDEFYKEIIKINKIRCDYPHNFSNDVYVSKSNGIIRPPFDIVLYIPVYELINPNDDIE